jgi:hypothetical protein
MLKLSAPQQEHAAKLIERDPAEQPPGLGEGEPEFLQGHDPVELSQLLGRVAAIPGAWVDARRPQQPDLVVMPERADRYAAEPGELADAEHDTSMQPSRNVRVKGIIRWRGTEPELGLIAPVRDAVVWVRAHAAAGGAGLPAGAGRFQT